MRKKGGGSILSPFLQNMRQMSRMKAECMVRRASDADMDAVLAFAAQIFADEQDIPKELNFIPADKQPQWWCMEQDGELVGTAAIYREDGQWHMGRITVARRLRGQHKGTFLLKRVLDDVFAQDVDNIFLEARDATVHILIGFGAEIAGEPFAFYCGNVTPMILTRTAFLQHTNG